MPGTNTSAPEVTHVSQHGFWLLLADEEVLLPFEQFPWFRRATIAQLSNVEWPSPDHLYWPTSMWICLCGRFGDQMRFRWWRVSPHSRNIDATDIAPIRNKAHYRRMVTTGRL